MVQWARHCGWEPAAHHRLLIKKLEEVVTKGNQRVIVCMPPGSAKSTYISALFPPWFLAQKGNQTILACSYSKDLIQGFGRRARNYIELHELELGFSLAHDSKAADEWETTTGGRYFCAGVNAGIAGHRADLGFIDDPIGSDADARSQTFRDNLWKWFWDDFMPRLKPGGSVIIVANRRHEDDLVGRLVLKYPLDWELIKMPLVVETAAQADADLLGRHIGDRLWPEWFTERTVEDARRSENFSGLHQQDPAPAEGDLIKSDWLVEYNHIDSLPADLRFYVGSDHALTTKEENDCNCLIPVGVDKNDDIWILPDVWWKRSDTGELVEAMIDMGERRRPVDWFAEDEHINKAIGPFLRKRMSERKVYFTVTGLTSFRDLAARSSSIRGRMKMCKVHFPVFASWWNLAKHEMLSFPVGKHDDFVAALSEIGRGLDGMTKPRPQSLPDPVLKHQPFKPTIGWLKSLEKSATLTNRYGDR